MIILMSHHKIISSIIIMTLLYNFRRLLAITLNFFLRWSSLIPLNPLSLVSIIWILIFSLFRFWKLMNGLLIILNLFLCCQILLLFINVISIVSPSTLGRSFSVLLSVPILLISTLVIYWPLRIKILMLKVVI